MKPNHFTAISALILLLYVTGVLGAQQLLDATPASRLVAAEQKLDSGAVAAYVAGLKGKGATEDEKQLSLKGQEGMAEIQALLAKAPTDPELVRAITERSLWQVAGARVGSRSAPQVTQAATEATFRLQLLQVHQNQRIIELLEQVAKKK